MLAVESGWHGFSEVNRVIFDPRRVRVEEMADRLKEAGTYVRTLKQTSPDQNE
ncbi:MAG: hypothetical protein KKG47_06675 [Proteobacteria bacterium]|nr:hypothetical protein [Pseudomonadota bacterium]MBU1739742.1 hypothetical protein [Pseudomonadota bacterium]